MGGHEQCHHQSAIPKRSVTPVTGQTRGHNDKRRPKSKTNLPQQKLDSHVDNKQIPQELVGEPCETACVVDAIHTTCLIDSGSVVTTIQKQFYDMHLRQKYPLEQIVDGSLRIEGANGQPVLYEGYISVPMTFPADIVGIDTQVNVLAIIVTRPISCPSPVIVGTNVFKTLARNCRAHLGPNFLSKLQVSSSIRVCFQKAAFQEKLGDPSTGKVGKVRCRLRHPLTVKPSKVIEVTGSLCSSLPQGQHSVLIQELEGQNPHGLTVINTMYEVFGKKGRVKVLLANSSKRPITLHNRQVIAEAYTPLWSSPLSQVCANIKELVSDTVQVDASTTLPSYFVSVPPPQEGDPSGSESGDYDFAPDTPEGSANFLRSELDKLDGLFAKHDLDYGCAHGVEHSIKLTDKTPWNSRARPIPQSMYEEARQLFQELLDAKLIRPSESAYSSPVCLVRKKSGKLRMTVDYRQPNRRVIPDAYNIPKIEELFNSMHGSNFFTVVDLKGAFFQIPLRNEDKKYSAFSTPFGLYEFERMPQGLKSSPAQMQRVVEKCLGDCSLGEAVAYIDDIVIHAPTREECIQRTIKVLTRVRDSGLKLEKEKCHFLYTTISHLGHEVSGEGIRPCPSKVNEVIDWPRPSNVQQLRQWLGFCGYYRRFGKNFSKICKPLTDLLVGLSMPRKSTSTPADRSKVRKAQLEPFREKWTDRCEDAFLELKRMLTSAPVLGFADLSQPFELHCDASGYGLGAVLYQEQDGVKRVISYASRGLNQAERNYCAWKREFLCLKWAVTEKFSDYLYGTQFVVITDNNPLTYVMSSAKLDATGQRWVANLSVYDFEIRYCPGKNLNDADSLSRRPDLVPDGSQVQDEVNAQVEFLTSRVKEVDSDQVTAIFQAHIDVPASGLHQDAKHDVSSSLSTPQLVIAANLAMQPASIPDPYVESLEGNPSLPGMTDAEWQQLQCSDPDIAEVRTFVETSSRPSPKDRKDANPRLRVLYRELNRLVLRDGVLYRLTKDPLSGDMRRQLVLPGNFVGQAMRGIHDECGHLGFDKCISLARTRFYFPFMASSIKNWIDRCDRCLKRKTKQQKAEMDSIITTQPLELLCIDFLSIEPDNGGIENVLVMTDHFSKYAVAVPTKDQRSSTVAKALWDNFIVHYGWPAKILSDQAQDFNSQLIKELCAMAGVEKIRTTPYHPQSNPVERFNRVLLDMLGCLADKDKTEWRRHVSTVVHAYNVCEHDTTHFSPYFLMFGRNARLPVDLALGLDPQWVGAKDKTKFIQDLRERLSEAYERAASNMAKRSQSNKMRYDKCAKAPVLEEGDTVLIKNVHLRGKHKLANRWGDDVYVVLKKVDNSPVYRVRREGSDDPPRTLHRNLLLPYCKLKVQDKPSTQKEEPLPPKPQRPKRPNTRRRTRIAPINTDSESDNEERYVFPVPQSDAMSDCEGIKGGETDCGDSSSQEEIHTVVPEEVSLPPSTSNEVEPNNNIENNDNQSVTRDKQTEETNQSVHDCNDVQPTTDLTDDVTPIDNEDSDQNQGTMVTPPSEPNVPLRRSSRSNKGVGPSKLAYHHPGEQLNADFKLALVQQMRAFMENLL